MEAWTNQIIAFAGLDGDSVDWPKLAGATIISLGILNLLLESLFAVLHSLGYVDHHLWGLKQAGIGSAIVFGIGTLMYSGELSAVIKARFGGGDDDESD